MMPEDSTPSAGDRIRSSAGIIATVAQALAASVEVFLHKPETFGVRYMGLQAAAATLIIFFWPVVCAPTHDPRPMFAFLVAYLFMCLVVRVRTAIGVRRGDPQQHSRYNGTPRLMPIAGRMSEVKIKRVLEPAVTWFIGGCTLFLSPPLGGYLMVAGFGLLISNGLTDGYAHRRAMDMHDAYLEQRSIVDRFRDMRGD